MIPIYHDSKHDDETRRKNLYQGSIYIYGPTASGKELAEFAAEFCKSKFKTAYPPTAQHEIDIENYIEILKSLKPEFIHHPECKRLIPNILQELGCDSDTTYFDVPRLRTACTKDYLSSGLAYAFKPHRDTWYSTPMCQLNWWMPIFPFQPENSMAFHFNYWDKPIRNSSYQFNYQDWNSVGRKQAHTQGKTDTRVQSEALEDVCTEGSVSLVCEPGGLIIFSAAHLHSTVENTSNETRISVDFRTVNSNDLESGAINVDSESTGTTMMDYLRCSDLVHFTDDEIVNQSNLIPTPIHSTQNEIQLEKQA